MPYVDLDTLRQLGDAAFVVEDQAHFEAWKAQHAAMTCDCGTVVCSCWIAPPAGHRFTREPHTGRDHTRATGHEWRPAEAETVAFLRGRHRCVFCGDAYLNARALALAADKAAAV